MQEIPVVRLPDRGGLGPRACVEFERDVLVAVLRAAEPELGRLNGLRMDRQSSGDKRDDWMLQVAGVACNDVIRLTSALKSMGLLVALDES